MNSNMYRARKLFFSGSLRKEYLIAASIALLAAGATFYFKATVNGSEFFWQALLGIFTGLFVGYVVDAVESWHKTKFLSLVLSPIRVEEPLPVVVATLPFTDSSGSNYKRTGPGETIGIGLLYSAYSSIFSTASRSVSTSNISVISSENADGDENSDGQRIIIGGPRYNKLTKQLLGRQNILIHYSTDENGNFRHQLTLKDMTQTWTWVEQRDFGLVIRLGRQLHVSGCRTWGAIGAATCLFSESSAARLVTKLRESNIDPVSDNYFAVISCSIPNPNDQYSIGEVSVVLAKAING